MSPGNVRSRQNYMCRPWCFFIYLVQCTFRMKMYASLLLDMLLKFEIQNLFCDWLDSIFEMKMKNKTQLSQIWTRLQNVIPTAWKTRPEEGVCVVGEGSFSLLRCGQFAFFLRFSEWLLKYAPSQNSAAWVSPGFWLINLWMELQTFRNHNLNRTEKDNGYSSACLLFILISGSEDC